MTPNPFKSRCVICKQRPKWCSGKPDSDFIACECKNPEYDAYIFVIYAGDELPLTWKLDRWYAVRFHFVRLLRYFLKV
jgi:hypothetical protein